jgi:anti-sigma regulatory factor (Ser/Thr protein kinase)
MSTVELRFAALPGHVQTARRIAMAVARRGGVPTGALDEIRLAVGEACLRAVNVNRRRAPEEPIEITMTSADGMFTVTVADAGELGDDVAPGPDGGLLGAPALFDLGPREGAQSAWDPSADLPGDQEPGAAGSALPPGIGLAIIEGLVDDVQIRSRPSGVGTVLTMTWDVAAFIEATLAGGMAAAGNPAL